MADEVRDQIIVGGTEVKYVGPLEMTYDRALAEWLKVRGDMEVSEGAPIEWRTESGEVGTLRPGGTVKAEDGLQLKIDAGHLS